MLNVLILKNMTIEWYIPKYKFPLKVTGQSPYSITICILCGVATNCFIQDTVYNVHVHVAALLG